MYSLNSIVPLIIKYTKKTKEIIIINMIKRLLNVVLLKFILYNYCEKILFNFILNVWDYLETTIIQNIRMLGWLTFSEQRGI